MNFKVIEDTIFLILIEFHYQKYNKFNLLFFAKRSEKMLNEQKFFLS